MRNDKFILDAKGEPVPAPDLLAWGRWYQDSANSEVRRVAKDYYAGVYCVSTVFLALDHNFSTNGPPVLWETAVFGGPAYREMKEMVRCAGSREQALAMHSEVLEKVKAGVLPEPEPQQPEVSNYTPD